MRRSVVIVISPAIEMGGQESAVSVASFCAAAAAAAAAASAAVCAASASAFSAAFSAFASAAACLSAFACATCACACIFASRAAFSLRALSILRCCGVLPVLPPPKLPDPMRLRRRGGVPGASPEPVRLRRCAVGDGGAGDGGAGSSEAEPVRLSRRVIAFGGDGGERVAVQPGDENASGGSGGGLSPLVDKRVGVEGADSGPDFEGVVRNTYGLPGALEGVVSPMLARRPLMGT